MESNLRNKRFESVRTHSSFNGCDGCMGVFATKMSSCCCVVVANVVKTLLFQLLTNGIGLVGNGLKLPPGVNFINVLRTNFSYQCRFL